MSKMKEFLDSKTVKKDVGEETYLTWRETISYALGRGAQGMFTSMTGSKYLNYFLTNILLSRFKDPMGLASKIRLYCGIFDAINDPMMGIIVDKTKNKRGADAPVHTRVTMVHCRCNDFILFRYSERYARLDVRCLDSYSLCRS